MHRVLVGFGAGLGAGAAVAEALRSRQEDLKGLRVSAATAVALPPPQVCSQSTHFVTKMSKVVHVLPTQISPAVTAPSIALPEKGTVPAAVPPEPAPGFSRVAEIMRFGFPGLDNIRSCK